jgi:hypothetical protein
MFTPNPSMPRREKLATVPCIASRYIAVPSNEKMARAYWR